MCGYVHMCVQYIDYFLRAAHHSKCFSYTNSNTIQNNARNAVLLFLDMETEAHVIKH